MAEAQNVLQLNEQDAFCRWMAEVHGYEYDDMLSIDLEAFRLTKPDAKVLQFFRPWFSGKQAGILRFYAVEHIPAIVVTYGPGVEFINEWRKTLKEDLSFLD